MKTYKVTFTLTVTDVIEADSKVAAEQEFSERYTAEGLLEYGKFAVETLEEAA